MTMIENLSAVVGRVAGGLGLLGRIALACMVLSICYDVVMRYVFNAPTHWSLEVNTFLLIFIALVPAAEVLREDRQLRITFFVAKLSPGVQRRLHQICGLVGAAFCALMTWKGLQMALHALQYDERMSTPMGTPMVIPYLFVPVGFGVMGLEYLLRFLGKSAEAGT
jgi:TRAP-type C4-dicarboxylate transport system permease small subunit